jgi:hypothetical protein
MSEIFSVQLTAAATLALAALALATAILALLAWRKQTREVSDQAKMLRVQSEQLEEQRKINARQIEVLELQTRELQESLDERKREAKDLHRIQAAQVYCWETYETPLPPGNARGRATLYVRNTSQQPVYELQLSWYTGPFDDPLEPGNAFARDTIMMWPSPLMPGEECNITHLTPSSADTDAHASSAVFRDHSGAWWRTWPNGHLDELTGPPIPITFAFQSPGGEPVAIPPDGRPPVAIPPDGQLPVVSPDRQPRAVGKLWCDPSDPEAGQS